MSLDEQRPVAVQRPDLKEDAAYAFAFFGDASEKFRQSVVEQTIVSYLIHDKSASERTKVEAAVVDVLQLDIDQVGLVKAAIDRMMQEQRLRLCHGSLTLDGSIADEFGVMRALREKQWKELLVSVDSHLAGIGLSGRGLESASNAVMERAGALFMFAATSASARIGVGRDPAPIRQKVRRRLKEISAELAASGMPDSKLDTTLTTLARIVSDSDIGQVLMAGELFVSLAGMQTNHFERAFGVIGGSEIYLDASVAIPTIAALLYQPADHRFSEAAVRVYRLAERREIPMVIPSVYLEEAASHLLEAVDRYRPLLGSDDDLRYLTNAFVAHYSDLVARKVLDGGFLRYAENLGYVQRTATLQRQREEVAGEMRRLFAQYGIRVVKFDPAAPEIQAYAEEAIAFTARELGKVRFRRLLENDAGVIAHFMEVEPIGDVVRIFCTWDKLHLQLETDAGRAHWQPLDPPMLGDLLVLTRPEEGDGLMTTVDVALELDEEDGRQGAAILDTLVRIESGNVYDGELLAMIKEFKEAYLQALRENATVDDMSAAWTAWKGGDRELIRQPQLPLN